MSVTVSYGSLLSFLDGRVDRDVGPTDPQTGHCLVAGGIVGGNLEAELARREVPTAGIGISTIEDTARTLLESHHRRQSDTPERVEIIDQPLGEALVVDVITSAPDSGSLDAVADLLSRFDWAGRPALRDTLWHELDRYFRLTDAGGDHAAAVGVADELAASDPYAGRRSRQALTAFDQLHTALQARTDSLPESTYLSRSHLVAAAREVLATEWTACYPDVEWVALDTVSVLDNPTLRLFEALATLEEGPDIYVFGSKAGAGPTLYDRLASTSLDPELDESDTGDRPHTARLMATVAGEPPDSLPTVEFVEAPDGRRELDHVAGRIRELTGMVDGGDESKAATTPGEIVVAAKDVIPYRSRIADVFTSHGIPTYIEARKPLMQTVPYRYLRAVFDLLAATDEGKSVTADDLVDPLRLGFCPPDQPGEWPDQPDEWPVDGETVADIERRLEAVSDDEGEPVADWRAAIAPDESPALVAFVDWIEATAEGPPESGTDVAALIESLLDAHLAAHAGRGVRQPTGPGIDARRTALGTEHDARVVDRLRGEADRAGSYVDRAVETDLGAPGWGLAAEGVRNVCGGASYWPRDADGNAVRIVNAANAHYLEADYVFVIGLAAGEFPAERSPPSFFHEDFYTAVRETAAAASGGPAAYLHAPTGHSQFAGDAEEFRAAVDAASGGLGCYRQYRTTEGEPVAWSGFVDAYIAGNDAEVDQIGMDEWLPTASGDDPTAASRTSTPRDRLRLLAATFPDGVESGKTGRSTAGLTDAEAIAELLSRADGEAYEREIEPRRQRYRGVDLWSTTVDPDDPAVGDRSLADHAGSPIRLHELDLYANCQLKYYFHRYVRGGDTERDRSTDLPAPIGGRYPSPEFTAGLRRLLTSTDRLADRQATLGGYDSIGAFRDQLVAWIERDGLDRSLMQPLLGEYRAVEQELAAGVDREWRWQPASTVNIDGHEVRVPGHRVDTIPTYEMTIPVWYTGGTGVAERLVRESLEPSQTGTVDHRLLLGAETTSEFGGTVVCDPSSSAVGRQGFFVDDLNPIPDRIRQDANLSRLGRAAWQDRYTTWHKRTASRLDSMAAVDEPITYRVSESFVDDGGCRGCDYRALCGVPAAHQRGGQ
ncbi:hypothetical protein [Halohasta salina]|uniref:hypothetical protein n=1 Tax=Halohasta salina TaxID=2961621 RepID=UPI0020A34647|nr:hypothetical protein [Halohasta salina]